MELNPALRLSDVKMGLPIVNERIEGNIEHFSTPVNLRKACTTGPAKDTEEQNIFKVTPAAKNDLSSLIFENVNSSKITPQGSNKEDSLMAEWETDKQGPDQSGLNRSEGSVLISQAHNLVDLFHELFKTSSTPLHIVLEHQESGEELNSERRSYNLESNLANLENLTGKCNDIIDQNNVTVNNDKQRCIAKQDHGRQNNKMESLTCRNILSTVQVIHRCHYCSFGSETISVVLNHMKNDHPNRPLRTKTLSGRNCPYCCVRLEQTAFFQHMRQFHGEAHPFRCAYCSFMGRDLNQVKHHYSKKHKEKPFKCFRRAKILSQNNKSSPRLDIGSEHEEGDEIESNTLQRKLEAEMENATENPDGEQNKDVEKEALEEVETLGKKFYHCPVCQKKIKTLKYLKVHMRVHGKGRYKCGYCSYLSAYLLQVLQHCKRRHRLLQPRVKHHELDPSQNENIVKNIDKFMDEISKKCTRQPPDPDSRKWARKYNCPHCEYTCSYGASYRRHLSIHTSKLLPFQCKYCSFEGREKYYIRRHIQRIHRGLPVIVVEKEDVTKEPQDKVSPEKIAAKRITNQVKNNLILGKSQELVEKTDTINLNDKPDRISEISQDGILDVGMKTASDVTKEETIKAIDSAKEASRIDNADEAESMLQVIIVPESTLISDGEARTDNLVTHSIKEHSIQKCKSKKSVSNKKNCKGDGTHKGLAKNKDLVILPKENTVVHSSDGMRLELIAQIKESSISGDSASNSVSLTLDSVPQDERAKKTGFLIEDLGSTQQESVTATVDGNDSQFLAKSIPKDGKNRARKKLNQQKPIHRAWDFVAYKDEKHTFCICGARTVNKAFYKHAKKHMDSKPFGCDYCSYRSIERAKVRVHHTFTHPGLPVKINETVGGFNEDLVKRRQDKTSLISVNNINQKASPKDLTQSVTKKHESSSSQDFQCPICNKKIGYHTHTVRRHLFSHYEYRPYKCGRCDFCGCSPGEIKQHSVLHGADLCPIVIPSGQEPPEGLEKLLADCFEKKKTSFSKKTRKSRKGKTTKVKCNSAKEDQTLGYKLLTKEAISWQETLSRGECPWCTVKMPSRDRRCEELPSEAEIKNHFKIHFCQPMENTSESISRIIEESSLSMNITSSVEEKNAVVMNGLMYYFVHHPVATENDRKEHMDGKDLKLQNGEIGIISCPDGMPQGTIQITDSLLADLRFLLWGKETEVYSKQSSWNADQSSKSAVAIHLECSETLNHQQAGTKDTFRSSQYPLLDIIEAHVSSQVPDAEVGVLLLGGEIEMTTAVVVVNPETEANKDVEMGITI